MNWMVKADFPTPDQRIPERMGERVTRMLTTTTDDDEFVLSQELCLKTISRNGSTEEWCGVLWTWYVARNVSGEGKGRYDRGMRGEVPRRTIFGPVIGLQPPPPNNAIPHSTPSASVSTDHDGFIASTISNTLVSFYSCHKNA
jgi:hypothetical protein